MDELDILFTNPDGRTIEYVKVTELANFLCVADMTIFRAIKSGQLKAYQFGNIYRITKEQVLA